MTTDVATTTPAAPAPAAPTWPAQGAPMPAAPAPVPLEKMTESQAREAIRGKIHDKEFGAKLLAGDAAARAEWEGLHKRGFASKREVETVEDANDQAAARREQGWNEYLGWQKQLYGLNEEQLTEIRRGICTPEVRAWALEEKARLLRDTAWHQRFRAGERAALNQWGRVVGILGLRAVPLKDWPKP